MKLQIDFDKKIIKVEDNVNLGELVEKLQAMLPEWKTWKLETNVTINWSNPVTIIKEEKHTWPWNQPYCTNDLVYRGNVIYSMNKISSSINTSTYSGTHNVEV